MAKRDSTTNDRRGRNADPPGNLEDIIEAERARLMTVRSVLGCTRAALNNDDDSDLHPIDYADVVEIARAMIQETTIRLDSAYLQRFYERIQAAE